MVAETLTSTRAGSTFPAFKPPAAGGAVSAAYGSYEIAAAVEDGDIFEMCVVPPGARLLSGYFYGDDLDTGTEVLDMDMGWAANGGSGTYDAADPDGLGNLGVLTGDTFAAGNLSIAVALIYPFQNLIVELPYFTKRTKLQIEANVPANAGHVGTISLVAYYVVEEALAA
jgi:hypothetical protein